MAAMGQEEVAAEQAMLIAEKEPSPRREGVRKAAVVALLALALVAASAAAARHGQRESETGLPIPRARAANFLELQEANCSCKCDWATTAICVQKSPWTSGDCCLRKCCEAAVQSSLTKLRDDWHAGIAHKEIGNCKCDWARPEACPRTQQPGTQASSCYKSCCGRVWNEAAKARTDQQNNNRTQHPHDCECSWAANDICIKKAPWTSGDICLKKCCEAVVQTLDTKVPDQQRNTTQHSQDCDCAWATGEICIKKAPWTSGDLCLKQCCEATVRIPDTKTQYQQHNKTTDTPSSHWSSFKAGCHCDCAWASKEKCPRTQQAGTQSNCCYQGCCKEVWRKDTKPRDQQRTERSSEHRHHPDQPKAGDAFGSSMRQSKDAVDSNMSKRSTLATSTTLTTTGTVTSTTTMATSSTVTTSTTVATSTTMTAKQPLILNRIMATNSTLKASTAVVANRTVASTSSTITTTSTAATSSTVTTSSAARPPNTTHDAKDTRKQIKEPQEDAKKGAAVPDGHKGSDRPQRAEDQGPTEEQLRTAIKAFENMPALDEGAQEVLDRYRAELKVKEQARQAAKVELKQNSGRNHTNSSRDQPSDSALNATESQDARTRESAEGEEEANIFWSIAHRLSKPIRKVWLQ